MASQFAVDGSGRESALINSVTHVLTWRDGEYDRTVKCHSRSGAESLVRHEYHDAEIDRAGRCTVDGHTVATIRRA